MPPSSSTAAVPLPRWLVVLGSLLIVFHFGSVGVAALAAPSGPWPTGEGQGPATPPQFAYSAHQIVLPYLQAVKLDNNYHFASNRPEQIGVQLEVRLKDDAGQDLATVKLPDPNANPWVRHRQALLLRGLTYDDGVAPPQGEAIAAPNRAVPKVPIWDVAEQRQLRLKPVEEHLIPRDRPVMRPSEYNLLLVRAFARHLCREHQAAVAEVLRHHQDPIPPLVLFEQNLPPGAFEPVTSNYGELPR